MAIATKRLLAIDESQRQFCETKMENIRLLAPAGCGKTLSLAHRCLHLLNIASAAKTRFLVITFTRAAKDEFQSRIQDNEIFSRLVDCVEVTTLNSWGYRRLRSVSFNHRLVTSPTAYHFAMLNQLQPVWKQHKRVSEVIEANKHTAPRKIMDLMDSFKSMGFDHTRDTNLVKFEARVEKLHGQGLTNRWNSISVP